MIVRRTPNLEASAPSFKDGLRMRVGGDVELSRQIKHRFQFQMFSVKGHKGLPPIIFV
jgi:hypothetical protein